MFCRQMLQSVTLLSLFQLVFSERSAHNIYSYLCNHSPNRIESCSAAFAYFKSPVNKLLKSKNEIGLHNGGAVFGYGKASASLVGKTQRNLFSFNLNDLITKREEKSDISKDPIDSVEKSTVSEFSSWSNILPKSNQDRSDSQKQSNVRSSFGLSKLINVEALLLASGKDTFNEENDTNTKLLLKEMIKQNEKDGSTLNANESNRLILSNAEDQLTWNALMQSVEQNFQKIVDSKTTFSPSFEFSMAAEMALREATQTIEKYMNDAASSVSPEKVQELLASASQTLAVNENADVFKMTMDKVVALAETLARDQGVDVSEAAAQARATTKYTAEFVQVANGVLVSGYVRGGKGDVGLAKEWNLPPSREIAKPLFHNFESVQSIADEDFQSTVEKGSDMALLSGAIYEEAVTGTHDLGHAIVANGTSADIVWMVTDKIDYNSYYDSNNSGSDESPILVRTITLRGFDASDESVDRENLLNQICNATQVPLSDNADINVHRGLFGVAKEIYKDIIQYIDMAGPNHKIVLNGHSIGGSLAILILFLLAEERGADFVNEKILRVFSFGSPPVAIPTKGLALPDDDNCPILKLLDIHLDKVYGYVQPWDPIVRMFSRIDPLYPLIGDLGEDGKTLYASGPPRTLRPVTRAIIESWENWSTFRDNYRDEMNQEYLSTGVQHLLMPDSGRYLTDRLVSVNVATFPIDDVLRVSPRDLYSALETAFPLDTFTISLVPTAIRSFIHHFFPAYTDFASYTKKKMKIEKNNK